MRVSVITVAPIALEIAKKSNITKSAILLAMVGGGKAGNIISLNPNTIAISENLNLSLTSVMSAGIISSSTLKDVIISGINTLGLPSFALAPVSGILMAATTASTTSGAAVASSVFGEIIVSLGVSSLATAAMIHVGCTVLDQLPHGSFFHSTGGSINMGMNERLKLIPYEAIVGLTMTIVSIIIFGIIM